MTPVSTAIFRTAKPGKVEALAELLRIFGARVRGRPGHLGVEVLSPSAGERRFAILVRFASLEAAEAWKASPELAELLRDAAPLTEALPEASTAEGVEVWHSLPASRVRQPPRWKSACIGFLAAYPLITILNLGVMPSLGFLPQFFRGLLMGIAMSIGLTYLLMPRLTRWMSKWLYS